MRRVSAGSQQTGLIASIMSVESLDWFYSKTSPFVAVKVRWFCRPYIERVYTHSLCIVCGVCLYELLLPATSLLTRPFHMRERNAGEERELAQKCHTLRS